MDALAPFREVHCLDTEFHAPDGERPRPLCLVDRELRSGREVRLWLDGCTPGPPPFAAGNDALAVAYYASAEWGCFQELGWSVPVRIVDLFAEFRNRTSGLRVPAGHGLLGALTYFGLPGMAAPDKEGLRSLARRGPPFTDAERRELLDYCAADVDALCRLFVAMLPNLDLPRALVRGRYTAALARMERQGVPVDADALSALREHWTRIQGRLIHAVDKDYGVFEPVGLPSLSRGTAYGEAVLETARDYAVNPYQLVLAAEDLWKLERGSYREQTALFRTVRERTGLTAGRIAAWERGGYDHSTYPGWDVAAYDMAVEHPELAIDPDEDPAADLWGLLRAGSPRLRPRIEFVREAAGMLYGQPGADEPPAARMRFSHARFEEYLIRAGLPWPTLASGRLATDDDTFRMMARLYPREIGPLRELLHSLGQLRLRALTVGSDGRNRCLLSPFASKTGRNQPSNTRYIFGPATWLRHLIRPEAGQGLAYVDWEQQEFGIAAALSGDRAMMDAYQSADPYLTFARMAGAVPAGATKATHKAERERFKVCALAVLYGMTEYGMARRLCQSLPAARELLHLHRRTFPRYWQWAGAVIDYGMLFGRLQTAFGWTLHVGPDTSARTLANFPMQGNGAEMLRLACCLATERGVEVCAPVHDALLVEGSADAIEAVVVETQRAMRKASEQVLPGFPLRTDAQIIRHPDRYTDGRGRGMWETVTGILEEIGGGPNMHADVHATCT
jgi:hypothetical protein